GSDPNPPYTDLLTYVANSGNPYLWSGRGALRKTGTAISITGGNAVEFHRIATNTGAVQRKSLHFVEITKGNPNFTVVFWSLSATGVAKDFSPAHLLQGLEQGGSITVNGEPLGVGTTISVAFSEAAGALDSVGLHWNRACLRLGVHARAG